MAPSFSIATLFKHFTKRKHPVQFTRSRAYHKDDNAHIEQKNWTHVRQWLGYQRLDNPLAVPLSMSSIAASGESSITSSVLPSNSSINNGSALKPSNAMMYQNTLSEGGRISYIPQKKKDAMTKYLETLNPFLLKKALERSSRRSSPELLWVTFFMRQRYPSLTSFVTFYYEATGSAVILSIGKILS